jgi:undecaprenyl-diphosphatase
MNLQNQTFRRRNLRRTCKQIGWRRSFRKIKSLLFLNNLGDQSFDQFWMLISSTWIWVPLYIIFCYFLFKNYKLRSLVFILIFVSIGVTVSDQLAGIFKYGVARLRPCHDPTLEHHMRIVKCGGQYGFYSAHASNTFFLAAYLVFY